MKKKSKFKKIIGIIIILCLAEVIGIGLYLNISYFNPFFHLYGNYISPDGKYRIQVLYINSFFVGPGIIRINAFKNHLFGGLMNNTYTTPVNNDGGIGKTYVSWDDDNKSTIIITGREQKPEYLEVIYGNNSVTIKHKEMEFYALQYDESANVFDHKIFEEDDNTINIYLLDTKMVDNDGNDIFNSFDDFLFFYQTLEYKVDRKKMLRDYRDDAIIYKADNFTFIKCNYHGEIENHYQRYVIGKKSMEYKPKYCDYNNDLEIGNS